MYYHGKLSKFFHQNPGGGGIVRERVSEGFPYHLHTPQIGPLFPLLALVRPPFFRRFRNPVIVCRRCLLCQGRRKHPPAILLPLLFRKFEREEEEEVSTGAQLAVGILLWSLPPIGCILQY